MEIMQDKDLIELQLFCEQREIDLRVFEKYNCDIQVLGYPVELYSVLAGIQVRFQWNPVRIRTTTWTKANLHTLIEKCRGRKVTHIGIYDCNRDSRYVEVVVLEVKGRFAWL